MFEKYVFVYERDTGVTKFKKIHADDEAGMRNLVEEAVDEMANNPKLSVLWASINADISVGAACDSFMRYVDAKILLDRLTGEQNVA